MRLCPEHIDQGGQIQRVHMLGQQIYPIRLQISPNPLIHRPQPCNGGEQAQRAPTGSPE
jgi:hypothetical protein